MLEKSTIVHVSIESPTGDRDWRRCSSLEQARQLKEGWPAGSVMEFEMVEFGVSLTLTITQSGTLV